jgi:rhamnosyltransferase
MPPMQASIVIRARDEAGAIGRTLDALAAQPVAHEVIVVDSGSRDGTPAIARERGARVLELPAERFTFGRALNLGAAEAGAPVVVALSAHAVPRDPGWLGRLVAWFGDDTVACAYGEVRGPDGALLRGAVRQDAAMLERNPYWGYSNSAGGFRADLWRERPFREDLPGTEDREWSLWALRGGRVCVLDPALAVEHDHSGEPLGAAFRRYKREHGGFAMFLPDLPPYRLRDAVREWWSDQGWHRSRARARLDPRRMARLAGKWRGRR